MRLRQSGSVARKASATSGRRKPVVAARLDGSTLGSGDLRPRLSSDVASRLDCDFEGGRRKSTTPPFPTDGKDGAPRRVSRLGVGWAEEVNYPTLPKRREGWAPD